LAKIKRLNAIYGEKAAAAADDVANPRFLRIRRKNTAMIKNRENEK